MPAALREVYLAFGEDSETGAAARRLIEQQHWYNTLAEFDPKTGQALPLGLDEVLRRLARPQETNEIRDRLWRIVEHSRASVARLFESLNESPRREQATLPIRAVRELNATSLIALNRRPGRNIREKLATNPYMQAVRRYQSIDLPENRLLKEYVTQIAELLELRANHLHKGDPLLPAIHRWLHTEEAEAISRWGNLPPNNTLLSHKDYRRIWDAWRWLQTLDEDTAADKAQIESRAAVINEWQGHAATFAGGASMFGGMPVLFDHETFAVVPWLPRVAAKAVQSAKRGAAPALREDKSVCVDLTEAQPRFAVASGEPGTLTDAYVWQRWQNEAHGTVDIELFVADFPMLWRESTTIAVPDLFFTGTLDAPLADMAAHSFAKQLRSTFPSAALTWLIPDRLNEFDLGVLRRNLNARFPRAEPLPRSVAAVFEKAQHARIRRDGFAVLVVDTTGGVTTATRLVAKIDSDLAERVPSTGGYYWERTSTISIGDVGDFDPLAGIAYVGPDGQWRQATVGAKAATVSESALRANPQIEPFDELIQTSTSPVAGGIKVHQLQLAAGDIPVWRDHIPELSWKVWDGGHYGPFYLVDKHTTIQPIRGLAVEIPVAKGFELPAGKPYYQFPLFQGSNASDLGYEARLDSPSFPLAADTPCHLTMTYTYGADDPYRLVLNALDNSIPPIQVQWRPKSNEPITDAPAPGYPTPLTWAELQHSYYAAKGRWNDYLDWVSTATERLLNNIENPSVIETRSQSGTVESDWRVDRNGKSFTFVDGLFLHESALRDGLQLDSVRRGDRLYYDISDSFDGRPQARNASRDRSSTRQRKPVDPGDVRSSLYVPYIKTWGDARSLADPACPAQFRGQLASLAPRLERAMRDQGTQVALQRELRFLFCCMHRDMPSSVSRDLVAGATAKTLDERAYAFALGDLSQDWQHEVFLSIWNRADVQMLSILAQAVWRTSSFVRVFDAASLAKLGDQLLAAMRETNAVKRPGKDEVSRMTRFCELLLGLLRSRDSDVSEVRMSLQPHQELSRRFADQVDLAAGLIERSGLPLRSRVEIADLPVKPEGDATPDLVYALRLYLTGDVGANAIRVTGVLDGEDD